MEVNFSVDMQHKLRESAERAGYSTEDYVRDLVERYIDDDEQFRGAIRQGFSSLDQGHFLDEDEMDARVAKMLGQP